MSAAKERQTAILVKLLGCQVSSHTTCMPYTEGLQLATTLLGSL